MSNFKANNQKRKWNLEISSSSGGGNNNSLTKQSLLLGGSSSQTYIASSSSSSTGSTPSTQNTDLLVKKAWELAKSPAKSIFMTGFLLWMIGNVFIRFKEIQDKIFVMKITYIVIQLALLGVALNLWNFQ
ncbi:DUF1077 family protein [Cavenderia fasciculata]|uniref:ER membrane protein complex subunit 4 n=1 Tax=Cavenderia fasciculata TaxID=261658 RepID=F4Q6B8_CACFS|nr:DUF1077 family protein [Cavenderia fasciculata]EGG16428.1 DUF1077 family protein [Cavenderia fasciculata]|eukprot:XP_004354828.1 DUF1077 family protein [Cavenderia fasciculata]